MRIILTALLCSALSMYAFTQEATVTELGFYADVIANAGAPENRQKAHKQFKKLMDNWIESDDFSIDQAEQINWLSVKSPEDKSFAVITWQLKIDENDYSYFGYIWKNGKVYPLSEEKNMEDAEYNILSNNEWLGVLYYNLIPIKKGEQDYFVLFGYNGHKDYEHRKVADVLYFENDVPVFGTEIFKKQMEGERGVIKNRLILDYSVDANVSMNYNPTLGMIVYDNLIPVMGQIAGQGLTLLPDGSYSGYKWDGEYFVFVEKLYDQVLDDAPFPKPILGGDGAGKKSKDLFGRERGN